jgi:N-acetylneuraminate synthase/N,N'-diacetyllegionaminate synthase
MQIRTTDITRDGPPFVIAEIGVNHDGSPDIAAQLVDAAHAAGAHAVKFQLFEADRLLASSAALVDYQESSVETGAGADDLLKPLELPPEKMAPLIARAHALNLAAIVTPFSPELVPACAHMHVDAIKLASPDLVNLPLLEAALATNLPLILSTGAADLDEIDRTLGWLASAQALDRALLLHCVSSYPTPSNHATLAAITVMRHRYPQMPIGYSDHTMETLTAALAVAAGASVLEKHLTLDRTKKGPDHAASLEPAQLAEYLHFAVTAHAMRGSYEKSPQPRERQIRDQTRQSLTTTKPLPRGAVLTQEMLTVKRPGTGIPAAAFHQTLGKKLTRPLPANTTLTPDDIT